MGQRVVLFRCDAGAEPEVGTGHLVRDLLLAEYLRDTLGGRCAFAVRGDAATIARATARGFEIIPIAEDDGDARPTCAAVAAVRPDLVVVDRLGVGREYVERVKATGVLVALVDNSLDDAGPADLCINPVIDADRSIHGGADYAVFRPAPAPARVIAERARRVFLSVGGHDDARLLVRCLKELEGLEPPLDVDVVAGAGHPEQAELERIAGASDGRVRLHVDVPDVRPLLREADLAVVAGGLTMFECAAGGLPTVVVAQYEHQVAAAGGLARGGAVVSLGLGAKLPRGAVRVEVGRLLGSAAARRELSAAGRAAVDGEGLRRTAELLSVVRPLPWDSQFFGIRVGRVTPYSVTEDLLALADRWAREEGIRCLYYLADFGSPRSIRLAEEHGYRLADARVTLSRLVPAAAEPAPGDPPTRPSRGEDLPELRALAATAFTDSRFFFDDRFPRERSRELYAQWVEGLHRGPSGRVFVVELDGRVAGFIACDRVGVSRGVIGLIAVREGYQGRRVGSALVGRALKWFAEQDLPVAQVVTQGRNAGAQRLYQKCGFRTESVRLWYHKWFDEPASGRLDTDDRG